MMVVVARLKETAKHTQTQTYAYAIIISKVGRGNFGQITQLVEWLAPQRQGNRNNGGRVGGSVTVPWRAAAAGRRLRRPAATGAAGGAATCGGCRGAGAERR